MNDIAISITGLTKKFLQKTVVDHLSLNVKRGEIFGFLGANGSGKTTTLRMVCGLLTPTSGEGYCLGYNIFSQSAEIKKNIGYMPQKFSFYTGLSVYENLKFIATIYQVPNAEQAIEETIATLGLTPYRALQAASLSGGWKQVLALACCVIHKPHILVLDEPTAGMDPKARKEFWDYLHNISITQHTSVLVATHYMDEAEKCTDIAYIHMGKLLYAGKTKDLVPFSAVKTWAWTGERSKQEELIQEIKSSFPAILTFIVNNDLRISSRNLEQLREFIQKHHNLRFKEVFPSFEEVFILLIQ
ncbi:MAG: ABC transporter ATP-binding protein [Legionella sp.]|uniref:ABC transporter ATP-binding protein n=1 Tax=Legionella sp. TaxID=459 RepID=UPI0039E64765